MIDGKIFDNVIVFSSQVFCFGWMSQSQNKKISHVQNMTYTHVNRSFSSWCNLEGIDTFKMSVR